MANDNEGAIIMRIRTILSAAAAPAALAAVLLGTGGQAASAATLTAAHPAKPVQAVTTITNRPDSGGGGTWAYDNITRTADVYYLGKSTDPAMAATPYMYWGQVQDTGTFRDLPGQLAPNQGGAYAGVTLRLGQVSGPMTGSGQWGVFYASAKARAGLAPTVIKGAINAAYPTGTWVELLFPAGTQFSGVNLASWDWSYQAVPKTVTVNGHKVTVYTQKWDDGSLTGAGQLPRDGQILGVR